MAELDQHQPAHCAMNEHTVTLENMLPLPNLSEEQQLEARLSAGIDFSKSEYTVGFFQIQQILGE